MEAYKDEQRGTWYVSFHYYDWTGKNCRKVKRGFKTKREATEWERHFRMKEAADLDMTFEEFVQAYTRDMKPKIDLETISIEIGKHVVASSPVVMACPDAYVDTSNSAESPYFSYPILGVENPRHFYACYRKDMYLTKYMKGFLEILHALRNPAKNT